MLGFPRGPDVGSFVVEIDCGYCFTVLDLMVEILSVESVFMADGLKSCSCFANGEQLVV